MAERTLEQWRDTLVAMLRSRRPFFEQQRRYFDGEHPLPTAPDQADPKYVRLAQLGITNVCELIVTGPAAKLLPTGVRVAGGNADSDLQLWQDVWVTNHLNADCRPLFEESLKVSRSAVLVWPTTDDTGTVTGVRVTVEDAAEVIVAYAPGDRRKRLAALKLFVDEGFERATVWTAKTAASPAQVFAWRRQSIASTALDNSGAWEPDPDETTRGTNPFDVPPIIEFLCRPNVKGEPTPELSKGVLRLQDRLNKQNFDVVVGGEDGAFPVRVGIGIEVPKDADGNPLPMRLGPNRWVILDASDPQNPSSGNITQLEAFDNAGALNAAEATMRILGLASRTSALLMTGGASNIGADLIRALDDGHKSKVLAHQAEFGEACEEIFKLALVAMERPVPAQIEIDWAPVEFRSPTEQADAVIKMRTAGYPIATIAAQTGASQAEIQRMLADRAAELAAGTAPDSPAVTAA